MSAAHAFACRCCFFARGFRFSWPLRLVVWWYAFGPSFSRKSSNAARYLSSSACLSANAACNASAISNVSSAYFFAATTSSPFSFALVTAQFI